WGVMLIRAIRRLIRLIKIARQHDLGDQAVRRWGQPKTQTCFDVKLFALIIDDAKELLRLLIGRKEMFDHAIVGVLLDSNRPGLRYVVRDTNRRREVQVVKSLPRIVKNRIDDEIEFSQMPAEDRTVFPKSTCWDPNAWHCSSTQN